MRKRKPRPNAKLGSVREASDHIGVGATKLYEKANEGCFDLIDGKVEFEQVLDSWRQGWAKLARHPKDTAA